MKPKVVMLAGPNGAGKSTSARRLLRGTYRVDEFVNADLLAQGLSAFEPDRMGLAAGRIMLARLKELAASRVDFAFETTLASRVFAGWMKQLIANGYEFHLVFLWLPSAEAALARVAQRVRRGGHQVPEAIVRRRYDAGLKNFFTLYQPLADSWQIIDNSNGVSLAVASGNGCRTESVRNARLWPVIAGSIKP